MKFKPVISLKKDTREWHRKFAFLPTKVGDEYHWLCNVYRKLMNFQGPVYDHKTYWAYIPYSSLDLIKQLDLESRGQYESREYTLADESFLFRFFPPIMIAIGIASITGTVVSVFIEASAKTEYFKSMDKKIEQAQDVGDLKQILREILASKK